MTKIIKKSVWLFCTLLLLSAYTFGTANRYEYAQYKMGTLFQVILYAENEEDAKKASDAAFKRIDELNDILSDYQADSELNRLSETSGSNSYILVSNDLFNVLQASKDIHLSSDGYFDITIGPLIKLWRKAFRQQEFPDVRKIEQALTKTGSRYIEMDAENQRVCLILEGMQLDVGGIGKGYALDEAMKVLRRHGISSALVDGGGDILVSGPPPGTDGWRIELNSGENNRIVAIQLKHAAVATSGDSYRYLEYEGKRYSHLINPLTGFGSTFHQIVSVIAQDGATADALASAVSVMGAEKGLAMVDRFANTGAMVFDVNEAELQYSIFFIKHIIN